MVDSNRLAGMVQSVIVSEEDLSSNAPTGWFWVGLHWFKPTTGVWKKWNGTAWEVVSAPVEGVSEEIPLEKVKTLVFKDGILVKYG